MQLRVDLGWLMTAMLAAIGCSGGKDDGSGEPVPCAGAGGAYGAADIEMCSEGYAHRPTSAACTITTGECSSDADCGAGNVCLCNDTGGKCLAAACESDADCGGSLCVMSRTGCMGPMMLACFTTRDECRVDGDCAIGQICTYDATNRMHHCVQGGCGGIGRPFLVDGRARLADRMLRADWSSSDLRPCITGLSTELRQALAAAWTDIGRMEHASIAAFARFSLQLLALGAPADFVEHTHAALADETRHARIAFALAGEYAGRAIGPGPLELSGSVLDDRLEQIVMTAIAEGCVGETLAAAEAAEAARHAEDPLIARLLTGIAEDESRHAALAWRFVAWAIDIAPMEVRRRILDELERRASADLPPANALAPELELHGFVVGELRSTLRERVRSSVIAPVARRLAHQSGLLESLSPKVANTGICSSPESPLPTVASSCT